MCLCSSPWNRTDHEDYPRKAKKRLDRDWIDHKQRTMSTYDGTNRYSVLRSLMRSRKALNSMQTREGKKKKKEAMQGYEAFCCTEREVLVHWDSVCFVTWLYAESMTKIYASYATHMTCVSDPRRTFTASSHLSLFDSSFSVVRILCHRIALFVIPSWHTQPQYYSWHS